MKELISIFIASIFISINASSQDFDFFEYPLNSNKITLAEAIEKYVNNDKIDFKYIKIGKRLHSLVVNYDHKIFTNNSYVLIRDTINSNQFSLNQIGLSSREFYIKEENFIKLLDETNKLIHQFEKKYGKPTNYVNNEDRYFGQKNEKISGDIITSTWVFKDTKLKISFIKGGDHGHFRYQLRINKFQDYLGNIKLPKWWDGY